MDKRVKNVEKLNYENIWELMKQMVDYYMEEKNYITKRDIKYIIRFCENTNLKAISIKDDERIM
ncbi:hypothetical protein V6B95_03495 [Thermoanaerobacterium saccharolyticum]|jgi:hypothetical protein|uniref:Uncharacterized protein n=1 Tax=Thermoanaerobacterium butyriciformans TaxID=1702242 RepID=A0ABS4NCK3_9THEO|nr:hypothetical protein [Thermoanaerobacterium butyriciformans]MBP2071406.1 hypothetical protein [Thermoanaerobacterium butyriciformans]